MQPMKKELQRRIEELECKGVALPMSTRDAMKFFAICGMHSMGHGAPIEFESMTPEEREFIEKNVERYIKFCEMAKWGKK